MPSRESTPSARSRSGADSAPASRHIRPSSDARASGAVAVRDQFLGRAVADEVDPGARVERDDQPPRLLDLDRDHTAEFMDVGLALGRDAVTQAFIFMQRQFGARRAERSEEHTSELQSLMRISYAVFCLKKKNIHPKHIITFPSCLPHTP